MGVSRSTTPDCGREFYHSYTGLLAGLAGPTLAAVHSACDADDTQIAKPARDVGRCRKAHRRRGNPALAML